MTSHELNLSNFHDHIF